MLKVWHEAAWADYVWWQGQDRKTLKRINDLIKSIERDGRPIGKAELLRHRGPGVSSVRIDQANRLVYRVEGDSLIILSCRGHYED